MLKAPALHSSSGRVKYECRLPAQVTLRLLEESQSHDLKGKCGSDLHALNWGNVVKRRNMLAVDIKHCNSGYPPYDPKVKRISSKPPPRRPNTGERHAVRALHRPAPETSVTRSMSSRMRHRSTRISLAVIGVYLMCIPSSLALADPENGQRLAERWCSACHVVATNQQRASVDVPPFSTIARAPGFNAQQLAFFLLEPHPKMPSMSLSRKEATDIADYIKRLRDAK
jgi:mono/diheme cytochrome c family protein